MTRTIQAYVHPMGHPYNDVLRLVAVTYGDVNLHKLGNNATGDQGHAESGDQHLNMPVRIVIMVRRRASSLEASNIKRHEGEEEPEEPEPERGLAPASIHLKPNTFGNQKFIPAT